MATQFIRISDVPTPIEMGQARAFAYHTDRYHRWVKGSGASPRIAVFLSNDALACQTFYTELESRDVEVVQTEVSVKRAIPESILRHQGDHFNRRLFVVNGLDTDQAADIFPQMERYVDHYAKVATWVGFLIKEPKTLKSFREEAPMLWSRVQRVVPIASTIQQSSERAVVLNDAIACLLSTLNGDLPSDYYGWSRWMRTGYGHDVDYLSDTIHQSADHLWRASEGFQIKTNRHSTPLSLVKSIHERHLNAEIAYPFVAPAELRVEDRALCDWINEMHIHLRVHNTAPRPNIDMLDAHVLNGFSPDLAAEGYLALAHARALDGELQDMLGAFESAVQQAKQGSPEILFEVYARQIETFMLLERHQDVRRVLSLLTVCETSMMSPFYEAKLLALKGRSLSLLDRMQGDAFLEESRLLFAAHGYPQYAHEVVQWKSGGEVS